MSRNTKRLSIMGAILVFIYTIAVSVYSTVEKKAVFDSCWWALMTITTVGYGDEYPHSAIGRIVGMILVMSAVFVILPTLTAYVASQFIVDGDEWTHEEQEEVKRNLREALAILKENNKTSI